MYYVFLYYAMVRYVFILDIKEAINLDLNNIVTPVNAKILNKLLQESGYDDCKREYLVIDFEEGFSLNYEGDLKYCQRMAPNLKLRVGNKIELWNKVMKEVELGRYARPFDEPPFENFVQSPIGLVPKDKGTKKTRLIFHLSFPKSGDSVNSGIPYDKCQVKYLDFGEAIKLCLKEGVGCKLGKSDMLSAFRHVLMAKDQWWLLVMKAEHPITKVVKYFVDKCLPFGSSISCAISGSVRCYHMDSVFQNKETKCQLFG